MTDNIMEVELLKKYDALYLSPHLDDATFSCGGRIAQQTAAGQQVLIVTLMAGDPPNQALSPYAQSLHDRWELKTAAVGVRRAEDIAACQILGAHYLHMNLPDCIYRHHRQTGEPLYTSDQAIFGEVHLDDVGLANLLATQLAESLPAADEIYVPLTVGHHVDHQLTRLAVEQWQSARSLSYYEDYPYAADATAIQKLVQPEADWFPSVQRLTTGDITQKIAAITAFASQFSSFWSSQADLNEQIHTFTNRVGGERVWRKV